VPPQSVRMTVSGDKHLLDLAGYEGIRVIDAGRLWLSSPITSRLGTCLLYRILRPHLPCRR
jgi:hypothetical protein